MQNSPRPKTSTGPKTKNRKAMTSENSGLSSKFSNLQMFHVLPSSLLSDFIHLESKKRPTLSFRVALDEAPWASWHRWSHVLSDPKSTEHHPRAKCFLIMWLRFVCCTTALHATSVQNVVGGQVVRFTERRKNSTATGLDIVCGSV